MYENIMVALDESESSQRALDEAIRIGKGSAATVRAVFVGDAAALASYPVRYRSEVSAMRAACSRALRSVCALPA